MPRIRVPHARILSDDPKQPDRIVSLMTAQKLLMRDEIYILDQPNTYRKRKPRYVYPITQTQQELNPMKPFCVISPMVDARACKRNWFDTEQEAVDHASRLMEDKEIKQLLVVKATKVIERPLPQVVVKDVDTLE